MRPARLLEKRPAHWEQPAWRFRPAWLGRWARSARRPPGQSRPRSGRGSAGRLGASGAAIVWKPRACCLLLSCVESGAGAAVLDLDDDVAEGPAADVAQHVAQRTLVPAHQLARLDLDAVHAAVGVRSLDDVALENDGGVIKVVGVPTGLLARLEVDPPDADGVILKHHLRPDRIV